MKSVKLSHDNYFDIEQIIRKVAKENNIKDISKINIRLSKEEGFVKFAIIDDWADYPEDFGVNETIEDVEENETEMKGEPTQNRRYTIYYSGGLNMNGQGIDYIIDKEDGDKWSPDQGLEAIIGDLSETHPEFYEYEFHIYVHGDFSGPSLASDYDQSKTPDDAVDKINDWLHRNTTFEKIGGEEE